MSLGIEAVSTKLDALEKHFGERNDQLDKRVDRLEERIIEEIRYLSYPSMAEFMDLKADVGELKEERKWKSRAILTALLTNVGTLVLLVVKLVGK